MAARRVRRVAVHPRALVDLMSFDPIAEGAVIPEHPAPVFRRRRISAEVPA